VEPLAERLRGTDLETRWAAARALRELAPPAAARRLQEALDDPDWRVRLNAARAFARIGADDQATPRLRAAAEADPDPLVRRAAAAALGEP
jgi:HEAT repeat protein